MTDSPNDEQIIVTVHHGEDETATWWLQPEESCWQIAQIAEDLEDHLINLTEDQRKEDDE